MPRKTKKKSKNNIALGILFSGIIVFLIILSLLGKTVSLFQRGKFNSSYPFSIKVENLNATQFVSLFPKQNRIALIDIADGESISSMQLPRDVEVKIASSLSSENLPEFFNMIFDSKNSQAGLTSIDKARMYLFVKSIKSDNIKTYALSSADPNLSDKLLEIYADPQIISEDLRVEVINATGVYGVGNNVAKLLANIGANVIFVKTADNIEKKSAVYYATNKSYTVLRLEKLFNFPSILNTEKSISDIIVLIGQDSSGLNQN